MDVGQVVGTDGGDGLGGTGAGDGCAIVIVISSELGTAVRVYVR